MKYLLMIYENEKAWETMPKAETEQLMGEYSAYTDSIQKSGNFVSGEALQPTQTATTVRVRDGKRLTTDGPFAETREQLGGFFLVEAKDLDEAIALASRIPSVRLGCVEIRPVVDFSGTMG
ncbi:MULTISPECIES: YciI family protein [Myxococcus]|uniref:YciI family protein n=1 Tax=Myxococcus TaxID=32 RepID=UPI0013D4C9FE|nr:MULTISPECIES: YciI family protein [Myxococcus]NVJ20519.1 YciI family protein [Myxococcus sp. AM011]